MAPEPNPFQPPTSEIGTDRPAGGPYRFRVRFLIGALALQLTLALLALAGSIASGLGWRMVVFVLALHVLPPAAAIVQLLRGAAIGIPLACLSAMLFMSLNSASSELRLFVQAFTLVLFGLVVWVGRTQGMFKRTRA